MSVSLSEFFCVELEPHELKLCLDYTSSECKLAAWYGDALLAMYVSKRIFRRHDHCKPEDIGSMSRKKAHYVSNATMKEFLLGHTDAVSRLSDAGSMSVHSFGTVFEALLELCYRKSGNDTTKKCVDKYCRWVDLNTVIPSTSIGISYCDFETGYSGSASLPSTESCIPKTHEQINASLVEDFHCWLNEVEVKKMDAARLKSAMLAVSKSKKKDVTRPGQLKSTGAFGHIYEEMATAAWRSNSKKWYEDKYYRCCGVREGVHTCLRPLWIDATNTCCHTGGLDIPDKKAEYQHGASQYGKGKTPVWTCCGLTAVAPGCTSTQPGNFILCGLTKKQRPSASYMTKIRQWLKEYEHVVKQEESKPVGGGGVVQENNWAMSAYGFMDIDYLI